MCECAYALLQTICAVKFHIIKMCIFIRGSESTATGNTPVSGTRTHVWTVRIVRMYVCRQPVIYAATLPVNELLYPVCICVHCTTRHRSLARSRTCTHGNTCVYIPRMHVYLCIANKRICLLLLLSY